MTSWPHKLDHIGIRVSDLLVSKTFYISALEPIGISLLGASEQHIAFGMLLDQRQLLICWRVEFG